MDKNQKFYILIEEKSRKYELVTENSVERKKWFDALKCSSNTAKDYKNSISKRPRNMYKLAKLAEKAGIEKIKEICQQEKNNLCVGLNNDSK